MLRLEGLRVRQGSFALAADLEVSAGARVAVVGASGSGKSTLLAAVAGTFLARRMVVPIRELEDGAERFGAGDLSERIGGLMAKAAVRMLDKDPQTKAILLVSKPPDQKVAGEVLGQCASTPAVATFLGITDMKTPPGVHLARTLEEGALADMLLVDGDPVAAQGGRDGHVELELAALSGNAIDDHGKPRPIPAPAV